MSSQRLFLERELERTRRTLREYRDIRDRIQDSIHYQLRRNFDLEAEIQRLEARLAEEVPVFRSNRDERKYQQEQHRLSAQLHAARMELGQVQNVEIPRTVIARDHMEENIR